ncbi:MAG: molecular chaperone DnaJ [Paludibacteraceae bacterium]|nr:molecular chaperone DnaJ [Paludibacteraceae bacterium]
MASDRDYYEILGVSKTATDAEIKSAYRKMAVKYHPDRQTDKSEAEKKEAEEMFKEAAEAYSVLSDPQKRQRYDQFGKAGVDGGAGGFGGFGGGMNMDDIFSQFGDIFGGAFGGGFGGGGQSRHVNQGSNIRIKVKLSLKEIANGCEKKLKVPHYVSCPDCNGTGAEGNDFSSCTACNGSGYVTRVQRTILGAMQTRSACPTCGGEGKTINKKCKKCKGEGVIKQEDVVSFNIPAGVQSGMTLTVRGKGNAPRRGGVTGDLLVVVEEEAHDDLLRDGDDLIYNALIPVYTAILGGTVEVPTVDGKAKIKVDPGTQPDKVLRLRGKGLPHLQGYGSGDLLVRIGVYIPENLSRDEKKIFEKFQDSPENFEPTDSARKTFNENFKQMYD